jgi:hypothetical protein
MPGEPARDGFNLRLERFEVGGEALGLVRGASIAAAVPANLMAIRDVDIERDWFVSAHACQRLLQVLRLTASVNSAAVG